MSKSYDTGIALSDSMDDIMPKVRGMLTDKNRLRKSDPGDPSICNLFPYHKLMTDPARLPEIEEGCRNASWGCVDCKKLLLESMERFLTPIQERRSKLDADTIQDIVNAGNDRAREFAQRTMAQVREAMGFDF
jgi:tryptophanyl-tRNA synthetase